MSYNGFEIDMVALGDADSLLVTQWVENQPERVLIDGGYHESADKIRQLLRRFDVTYIDHLICSHPHVDHAAGLVDLVSDHSLEFGSAWMHMPWNHVDLSDLSVELSKSANRERAETVEKSLQKSEELHDALRSRGIPIREPFEGDTIAFLTVCGPSVEFYKELASQFADADRIDSSRRDIDLSELLLSAGEKVAKSSSETLLDDPTTSPENESSVILGAVYNEEKFLFTADAGVQALSKIQDVYDLAECAWMQIPHHGSWRNVTPSLIEYFRPETAFVSAAGNDKHPRDAVVNAFKEAGSKVW